MPVSRRAGGGIGTAAGTQDHRPGRDIPLGCAHRLHRAVPGQDLQRRDMPHLYIAIPQLPPQDIHNIKGAVRDRKDPVAPLRFQRTAPGREERHGVLRREPVQRAHQKAAVAGDICQHLVGAAVVCHITAALAGDPQLLTQPRIGLQQGHGAALLCSGDGREHTGSAAADDNKLSSVFHFPLSHTRRTDPRAAPGRQRFGPAPSPGAGPWRQSGR